MPLSLSRALLAIAAFTMPAATSAAEPARFYLGADLSYANEMDDCGAVYRKDGRPVDVFKLFANQGANLVRVRIWNDATWTRYSNLADVEKTIRRAKAAGMQVLLDFHYSDDWADGDHQPIPKAWVGLSPEQTAKALYDYTYATLTQLDRAGLMPDMVQVGNETNLGIAVGAKKTPIDWHRNALLFNAGIRAVHDSGKHSKTRPLVMIHIAQPENVEPWFDNATKAGIRGYDLIGISYYRKWSTMDLAGLGDVIARVKKKFGKDVIVVETAYPFTTANADSAANILGPDSLIPGYPATPEGQRRYMIDLTQDVVDHGGSGVVYWEPEWVSTRCGTRWGKGSDWDNATFFDFRNNDEALPAFDFFHHHYSAGAR